MNDPLHEKAFRIFERACDLPHGERTDFVDRKCEGDAALRTEVTSLLEHDESPANLDAAVLEPARGLLSTSAAGAGASRLPLAAAPDRIGGYRVIRTLGEGGMGVVYEAEQDSPKRRVALKVIRGGLLSHKLIQRFEREAFVLGQLQHPGIAHIYESGAVELEGRRQPFFAMELIDGEPINAYAKRQNLSVRQRLELMARVCDAVQHAHQKAIIHRDLKPANILVAEHGTGTGTAGKSSGTGSTVDMIGQPKILDFGVARITDSDVQAVTLQTEVGQIVGTLAYMSPEQVAGDSSKLDTRCDVYAIGVVLFELLTDRLPLDIQGKSVAEAARIIRDEDPAPAGTLDRDLRGDVETIIAKALEKDPERRYASTAEFAADIRRHLQDEPIAARQASALYQLRKFARRNKGLVGGLALTLIVLIGGLISTGYYLIEARAQRDDAIAARAEADQKKAVAEAVSYFLTEDLLDAVAPSTESGQGKDVLMRDVLDEAAERLEEASRVGGRFEQMPLVEASIRKTLGWTYRQLGEYAAAELHVKRARELMRQELGEDHPDTLQIMNNLAILYGAQGRYDEAEPLYVKTLENQKRLLGEEDSDTLKSMNNLATLYEAQGRYDEAERLYVTTLEIQKRVLGEEHPDTLASMNNLAWNRLTCEPADLRDPETALRLARDACAMTDNANPPFLDTLALAQHLTGDTPAAIETEEKALSLLPPGAPGRGDYEGALARIEAALKEADTAEEPGGG